jgi:hypothetical protein
MWQELLHNKYLKDKTLSQMEEKTTNSPFFLKICYGLSMTFLIEVSLKLVMG